MPLIVVATSSAASSTATAKSLSTTTAPTTSWTVRLGLRFVNLQRASAQFRSIQSRDRFVSFGGIRHFHETETACSARLPVGHNADFFHRTVRLENRSQFRLGCAVGQITYVKVLHCSSSLSKSSKVRDSAAARLVSRVSNSRGGAGLSCIAFVRAWDIERTAEIRRDASRIPHRCDTSPRRSAASAALMSSRAPASLLRRTSGTASAFGAAARYPGFPTKNEICCGGVALRMSSQNLSRSPNPLSISISTRRYRFARHQDRASLMSAAQSTSMPSFRMDSARKSRLLAEVSTRRTRFFFSLPGRASESANPSAGVLTPPPASSQNSRPRASLAFLRS